MAGETPEQLYADLDHALLLVKEQGVVVPCLGVGGEAWTSDDLEDQAIAAERCMDCPLAAQCREYALAAKVTGGVWGGYAPDLDVARKQTRNPRKAQASGAIIVRPRTRMVDLSKKGSNGEPHAIGYPTMNTSKATATQIATGCNCGCGEPTGRNAMYRPGHDARHVSALVAEIFNTMQDGGKVTKAMTTSGARSLPSAPLQAKFTRAAERMVEKATAPAKAEAKGGETA
ncbi:WhiB family transcriptional regulator [Microbacterium sp. P06]|uniref:WhiB family transcriptional regulator n=1 Tax=Microbacterium sp. P06 TaxID=3366949 RepID=UPI003744FE99